MDMRGKCRWRDEKLLNGPAQSPNGSSGLRREFGSMEIARIFRSHMFVAFVLPLMRFSASLRAPCGCGSSVGLRVQRSSGLRVLPSRPAPVNHGRLGARFVASMVPSLG